MQKSVLLVLLLLQVFLLITAFTSADAASLVTGPQQPPDPVVRRNDRNMKGYSNCSWRAGACGLPGSLGPPRPPPPRPPPPPTSADAASLVTGPQQPPDPVVRRNDRNMRGYSNCSWRPGACGSAGRTVTRPPPPLPPTRPSPKVIKCMLGMDRDGPRPMW